MAWAVAFCSAQGQVRCTVQLLNYQVMEKLGLINLKHRHCMQCGGGLTVSGELPADSRRQAEVRSDKIPPQLLRVAFFFGAVHRGESGRRRRVDACRIGGAPHLGELLVDFW